jgi:hypothetical protein
MSTLMQRLMAAKLNKPLVVKAGVPTPAQPLVPGPVSWAERRARIAQGHAYRSAPVESAAPQPLPAMTWRKYNEPGTMGTPVPPPAGMTEAEVMVAMLVPGGPRGSCKAINAETGRQCALLAGHTKPHRHGSTEFTRVATPGQASFSRRDALDALATRHDSSPTHTGETP